MPSKTHNGLSYISINSWSPSMGDRKDRDPRLYSMPAQPGGMLLCSRSMNVSPIFAEVSNCLCSGCYGNAFYVPVVSLTFTAPLHRVFFFIGQLALLSPCMYIRFSFSFCIEFLPSALSSLSVHCFLSFPPRACLVQWLSGEDSNLEHQV